LPYGSRLVLAGAVRRLAGTVWLEQRPVGPGSTWEEGETLAPASDGSLAIPVQPLVTTDYRLTLGAADGDVLRVPVAAAATLAAAGPATAGRFAVGVDRGSSLAAVAARVEALTGGRVHRLAGLGALVVDGGSPRGVARLPGVAYVDPLTARRVAFEPNDPLAPRQWYLTQDRAFDFWDTPPPLAAVRVAVIDSGIDAGHPE